MSRTRVRCTLAAAILMGMAPIDFAASLLLPLTTDQEIEARVADLVGRANVRQLWVLFLDADSVQLPQLLPIGDLPAQPTPQQADDLVARLGRMMHALGATSIVTVWERYGAAALTPRDAVWARELDRACGAQGVALRAMLLSHRTGVGWIGSDDYTDATGLAS